MITYEQLIDVIKKLHNLSTYYPSYPITGRGFNRRDWPLGPRKGGSVAQFVWDLIPDKHKAVLKYSDGEALGRRGGNRNIVVSEEAYYIIKTLIQYRNASRFLAAKMELEINRKKAEEPLTRGPYTKSQEQIIKESHFREVKSAFG